MWGAEATLLEEFGARKIFEEAIVAGIGAAKEEEARRRAQPPHAGGGRGRHVGRLRT